MIGVSYFSHNIIVYDDHVITFTFAIAIAIIYSAIRLPPVEDDSFKVWSRRRGIMQIAPSFLGRNRIGGSSMGKKLW